jgi:hypothetical protein
MRSRAPRAAFFDAEALLNAYFWPGLLRERGNSPSPPGKRPPWQLCFASSIRAFETSCAFGEYQHPGALGALVAVSDGAVDNVGTSRAVAARPPIQHINVRDIPTDAPP